MTLDEWIEIDRKRRATLNAEFTVSANTLAMVKKYSLRLQDYRESKTDLRRRQDT